MPKRSKNKEPDSARESESESETQGGAAPARPIWSGTISFGLVSIPVDLFTGVRARQKSLKMVDKDGHALGRQYHCSADGKELSNDELVRGFETQSETAGEMAGEMAGDTAHEMVIITDEEFEALAPETSTDMELRRFVPREQIPSIYYDRPYFLAPAGKSSRAYNLLAKILGRTDRVAVGVFVMRSHEYLVAILSDNGVLRAETLRHADELRSPEFVELPRRAKAPAKKVSELEKEIESLSRDKLDISELEDRDAEALQKLAQNKQNKGKDVIDQAELQDEDPEESSAKIIDFMEVLKRSLSKKAVARTAQEATSTDSPKRESQVSRLKPATKQTSSAPRDVKAASHKPKKSPTRSPKGQAAQHRGSRS